MKIRCSMIDFYEGSEIVNKDTYLYFSKEDLYRCSLTVGKGSFDQLCQIPYYSVREMIFRIDMIKAFLNFTGEKLYKSEAFYLLDPSEKGAINYFLGMVLSNLVSSKKLNVKWLVHLDLYDKNKIGWSNENGKKPDFIGITNDDNRIVLESKGWTDRKKTGVEQAKQQLRAVLSVEGEQNLLKVASIFYENNRELYLEIIDPNEKELLEVSSRKSDYLKDYYAKVFLLIKEHENEIITIDYCEFITCKIECNNLEIGLLKSVYEEILNSDRENVITETITEILFEKYSDLERIIKTEKMSIGFDGIYVRKIS